MRLRAWTLNELQRLSPLPNQCSGLPSASHRIWQQPTYKSNLCNSSPCPNGFCRFLPRPGAPVRAAAPILVRRVARHGYCQNAGLTGPQQAQQIRGGSRDSMCARTLAQSRARDALQRAFAALLPHPAATELTHSTVASLATERQRLAAVNTALQVVQLGQVRARICGCALGRSTSFSGSLPCPTSAPASPPHPTAFGNSQHTHLIYATVSRARKAFADFYRDREHPCGLPPQSLSAVWHAMATAKMLG
jgi:hypothetical protein